MNRGFWDETSAAERYANGRPYFHPEVMARIWHKLALTHRMPFALDVGCGTGQSALALTELADEVLGIESSAAMVEQTVSRDKLRFELGMAESLPVDTASVDIVTVSSAFHWFHKSEFLDEAKRVLRLGGRLVIYDNRFRAAMVENSEFNKWMTSVYHVCFPPPPRSPATPVSEEISDAGLIYSGMEDYANRVSFAPEQLVLYMMTASNITETVEHGEQSAAEVADFLHTETAPLFTGPKGTFLFGGEITYARNPG